MICCELPLSLNNKTVWFSQIKTKQVRINLQLEQDESLIPEEEIKADGTKKAGLFSIPADLGVSQLSTQKKDQVEFQNKLSLLEGKTDAQKAIILKGLINEQNLKNRKMITKQLRLKKATENTLKLIEEAKLVQPAQAPKKLEREPDLLAEFKALVSQSSGAPAKTGKLAMSGAMAKKNATQISICSCGNLDPQIRGYCIDCVKKLKVRYDELLDEFSALQQEADDFNAVDMDRANEKLELMRAKAEQYEIKLSDV